MTKIKGTDALDYIQEQYGNYPDFEQGVQEAYANLMIGQLIYNVRQEAGMTQAELAKRVGTTQSVISRLEDADYEGHSLHMLQRIASALNKKVRIELDPINQFP